MHSQMGSICFIHCFDISYPAKKLENVFENLRSGDLLVQNFAAY